jgi:hypothetical protein
VREAGLAASVGGGLDQPLAAVRIGHRHVALEQVEAGHGFNMPFLGNLTKHPVYKSDKQYRIYAGRRRKS